MTHTSSCLTFNQRANSWRQPPPTLPRQLPLPISNALLLPRPHNDSSFNWIFATAATAMAMAMAQQKQQQQKNTKSDNENENENCNFRQAAVARFHFTLLCPVFAGFSLTFFHRLPGFPFFSLAFLCNWRSLLSLSQSLSHSPSTVISP